MLDLSWAEMAVIAAVAIVVIGPKELPRVLRTVGQWVRRLRRMASEFQDSVDEMVREADLDDLRNRVEQSSPKHLQQEFVDALDPEGADRKPRSEPAQDCESPSSGDSAVPGDAASLPAGEGEDQSVRRREAGGPAER
ncbi:MAG: Sec-independent protein translocase protein TatB [Acetobacterales bacterium]